VKLHKSLTRKRITKAVERGYRTLDNPGFCIACGKEAEACEPDARGTTANSAASPRPTAPRN
jgi:hypothetical protein